MVSQATGVTAGMAYVHLCRITGKPNLLVVSEIDQRHFDFVTENDLSVPLHTALYR